MHPYLQHDQVDTENRVTSKGKRERIKKTEKKKIEPKAKKISVIKFVVVNALRYFMN